MFCLLCPGEIWERREIWEPRVSGMIGLGCVQWHQEKLIRHELNPAAAKDVGFDS